MFEWLFQMKRRSAFGIDHLGYMNVQVGSSMVLGVPIPAQTLFLVDSALNRMIPAGEKRVRQLVNILDEIECKLFAATDRFAAAKLGEMELRALQPGNSETDALDREYKRWGMRLANQLGVPYYPFAERYQQAMSGPKAGMIGRS